MKRKSTIVAGWALMAWLVLSLRSGAAAPAYPAGSDHSQNTQPIAWKELGAKATAQYSGDGLAVNATADGAWLRCVFQKLEGEVTPQGLRLSSTAPGSSNTPFRVLAMSVGRAEAFGVRGQSAAATPLSDHWQCFQSGVALRFPPQSKALPRNGTVTIDGQIARFIRPGLIEEYSVSVDGLRQDFVLSERLPGEGTLRVELKVAGATTEALPDGVRLVLENSGRKLNYHRLRATDATGRELAARMEVVSTTQLAVMVEDGGAVYPVRIDPTFSDANWTSMGGFSGANDSVNAAVVDASGNLYIGGAFTIVGDVFASRIAKWNGSSWSALGSGMGGGWGFRVWALAVSGTDLYAAGNFTTAGGIPVNAIAKWNGSNWSALDSGAGQNGVVVALAISGSDLYAGGSFTTAGGIPANSIAKWNGTSWSALGSGMEVGPGRNGTVSALAISGTNLYAAGNFTTASGIPANSIAKWNGSNWSALGSGMEVSPGNTVYALAVSGSDLYAAGHFRTAGGTPANSIAKWNGSSWSALGPALSVYIGDDESGFPIYDLATVYALLVSGTNLYAAGSISLAGGTDVNNIAKWNGSSWSALGSGLNGSLRALAASGSELYAGGDTPANSIAKWNGSSWSAFRSGIESPAFALAVSGSDLYAGGYFRTAGGTAAVGVAKWTGTNWWVLDGGTNLFESVVAVSGTNLYAAGIFTTAGGIPANYVVKWNGSSWSALGSQFDGTVYALAVSGTDLYAAGDFTTAGGIAATNIAKWNGTSWSALGSGIGAPPDEPYHGGWVAALAVMGSDLYAAGSFTMAGGIAAGYVAKWNGSRWSALGSQFDGTVYALAVSGTDLYAAGYFTTAGGIAASRIAKWNRSSWSALGSGIGAPSDAPYYGGLVFALAAAGGDLYAGGSFTMAGGISAANIAKWNGSSWSALGSGITATRFEGYVNTLAVSGTDLYVGGEFTTAGDKCSPHVARARIGSAAKSIAASSGSALIQFSGVTGYEYDVQRVTSLTPPIDWTTVTISPLSPAADGSFTFTDTNAPPGAAYYRAAQR